MTETLVIFAFWFTLALLLAWWFRRQMLRQRSAQRLGGAARDATASAQAGNLPQGWLTRWLALAGFRSRQAAPIFVLATLAGTLLGGLVVVAYRGAELDARMIAGMGSVPGGLGDLLLPAAYLGPWFLWLLAVVAPTLYVRRARRLRVAAIEQDLPLTLDLLATLGESGVGFDAAIDHVLNTRLEKRPLGQEFRRFQADLLAGRQRIEAMRRLGRRIELGSVSVFVSALLQAEQLGMGLANVLRRQADDLRDRRREQANAFAAALPVKLMLPLVACFLPGIFVWTMGPIFLQFFQLADTIMQAR